MATVVLQEFEPLTHVLQTIPCQAQRTFSRHRIEWTCLDVSREYIAIGTDFGLVYLYDRITRSLQRLHLKDRNEVVSCVKLQSSVDYVVGVGTTTGQAYIFQLPSTLPQGTKELLQFTVEDVHKYCVTCMRWSQNAMKLFSSDQSGLVVCTEVDYTKNESRSYVLCRETDSVIQLEYCYRILLISSHLRTVLCLTEQDNRIVQVGTKPRKSTGSFGATFVPGSLPNMTPVVLAARPGLRLWRASGSDGVVDSTYLLRESVPPPAYNALHLLGASPKPPSTADRQLGVLLSYDASLLVSWHGHALYLIDPGLGVCIGCCGDVGASIIGVSTCDDEVFILKQVDVSNEGPALVRLAQTHRSEMVGSEKVFHSTEMSPVELLEQTASTLIEALRGIGEHFQFIADAKRVTSPPPNSQSNESVNSAQEASPSMVPTPENESGPCSTPIVKIQPDEVLQVVIYAKPDLMKVCDISLESAIQRDSADPVKVESTADCTSEEINSELPDVSSGVTSSSTAAISDSCSGMKTSQKSGGIDKFLSIGKEEFTDVVFSSYSRKPRKKKKVPTATLR